MTNNQKLIAEAKERLTVSRLGKSIMRETDRDLIVIRKLVEALQLHASVEAEPTAEEWAARTHGAREKAIEKGYTPGHDAEHGIRHLLNWAIDYARRGRAEDSSGLILSALALLDAERPDAQLSNVSIDGVRQTWQQLYEREHEQHVALQGYRRMLADLDRNPTGRHQGDYDTFVPGGISEGNPHLTTGAVIGYDIGGRAYVVPEPRDRGTLAAWMPANEGAEQ